MLSFHKPGLLTSNASDSIKEEVMNYFLKTVQTETLLYTCPSKKPRIRLMDPRPAVGGRSRIH